MQDRPVKVSNTVRTAWWDTTKTELIYSVDLPYVRNIVLNYSSDSLVEKCEWVLNVPRYKPEFKCELCGAGNSSKGHRPACFFPTEVGYVYKCLACEPSLSLYQFLLQRNPQDPNVYSDRGDAKIFIKDYRGALKDFNQSIEIDPEYSTPYTGRAWVKYLTKDYNGAIQDSRKALTFNPEDFSALSTLGRSQYEIGEKTDACSNLKKAVSIGTDNIQEGISFDYLKQNTKDYLASKEGAWCRNMPD